MVCGDGPGPNLHHLRHRSHEPKINKRIPHQRRRTMQSRFPPPLISPQQKMTRLEGESVTISTNRHVQQNALDSAQLSTPDSQSNIVGRNPLDEPSRSPSKRDRATSAEQDSSTDSTFSSMIVSPPSTPACYPGSSLCPALAYSGRSPGKDTSGTRKLYRSRNNSQSSINWTSG
jgi:hypothetical protein